jgi:hypothetical protein
MSQRDNKMFKTKNYVNRDVYRPGFLADSILKMRVIKSKVKEDLHQQNSRNYNGMSNFSEADGSVNLKSNIFSSSQSPKNTRRNKSFMSILEESPQRSSIGSLNLTSLKQESMSNPERKRYVEERSSLVK